MTFAFHFRSLISEHTITVDLLSNLVGINTELYCVLLRICSSLLGKSSAQQQQRGQFTDGRPNDLYGLWTTVVVQRSATCIFPTVKNTAHDRVEAEGEEEALEVCCSFVTRLQLILLHYFYTSLVCRLVRPDHVSIYPFLRYCKLIMLAEHAR